MPIVLTSIALCAAGLLAWLAAASRREAEPVAARRALLLAVAVPLPYLAAAWLPLPGGQVPGVALAALTGLAALALAVPTGRPRGPVIDTPAGRLDERTVMFSRAALEPGSERFDHYYADHPEHREADDRFRRLPGLLGAASSLHDPVAFAAAEASFATVARLADLVEGEPASAQVALEPAAAAAFVKGWARKLGAVDCGITPLQPHHLYSVKGRGPRWGRPVELDHTWAVALTVEMDHRTMAAAPAGPTVMESAQQYLESGAIAVQIAECLRRLGWRAEAHIDANYQVVCPLVARDAGLGEIGRMGLLMTPRLGPRVRIAVVTTDLPLVADAPGHDPTVLDFCRLCRKCADICPPRAIPAGDPEPVDGRTRWRIDQEACFSYWCRCGTDCGQCLRVCPYAHPDTALHNLVRRGLRHSALFRRAALRLDDLLYGRRPAPRAPTAWLPDRLGDRLS